MLYDNFNEILELRNYTGVRWSTNSNLYKQMTTDIDHHSKESYAFQMVDNTHNMLIQAAQTNHILFSHLNLTALLWF